MVTVHPYGERSREAILQLWSQPTQPRRPGPDADVADLYILLQGMLFTHILPLHDFRGVLECCNEKHHIEGPFFFSLAMVTLLTLFIRWRSR